MPVGFARDGTTSPGADHEMEAPGLTVRQATQGDAAGIRAVSLAAGAPDHDAGADEKYQKYLALLLATGAVCLADEGSILGWGATRPTPLQAGHPPASLLTDLFVDPAHHGKGIGAALLRALWPAAPDSPRRFTFASRHEHALPLYLRAGLRPSWPLLYLTGTPQHLPPSAFVTDFADAQQAAAAEAELTGHRRDADYAHWTRRRLAVGLVIRDRRRVLAAGAGEPGRLHHLTVDPQLPALAYAALCSALCSLGSTTVTVCLPGTHPGVRPLLDAGFRIADYDLAMATADLTPPTINVFDPGLA